MRKRMPFLRNMSNLPTALSVFASALGFWRRVVAQCAKFAFGHVTSEYAVAIMTAELDLCGGVALHHGTMMSPFATINSAFAVISHALAMSKENAEKFHFLLGAMITVA